MPAPRIGQTGQKYHAPAKSPTASHTASTTTTIVRYAARCRRTDIRVQSAFGAQTAEDLRQIIADLPVARLRRTDPRRIAARKNAARASVRLHLGAYAAMVVIVLTVWLTVALTVGAWYFWPVWPILGGAIGVVGHALPVRTYCR